MVGEPAGTSAVSVTDVELKLCLVGRRFKTKDKNKLWALISPDVCELNSELTTMKLTKEFFYKPHPS